MTQFRLIQTLKQVAACLLIGVSSPALSQTFELSLDQGRVAARQAALQGQFQLARDLALGLTDADENDRLALIVLAAVQPKLDASREGRRAGARAYRLSQTNAERYEAARLTALAAANEERYTLSQIWLRRAAVNAPDEQARIQTRNDYRGIRNLNPWSINLGFSITPSSNLNGGSETDIYSINGLPISVLNGSSLALSGTAATADFRLGYHVSRSPTQITTLTARLNTRFVWLSQDAKEMAPNSRNSDFAYQNLELGLNHQRQLDHGTLAISAVTGATWFGGEISSTFNRAGLTYGLPVSETVRLTFSGQVQHNNIKGGNPRTSLRNTISTGLSYATENGNRVNGQVSFDVQSADVSPNDRFETWTAQVSYAWAEPVGPMKLSVTGGVSNTQYRDYRLVGLPIVGGRDELRRYASVTAVFQDLDYAGFVPTMSIGFQDTGSNISRFQRDEYSINIGVRSSF